MIPEKTTEAQFLEALLRIAAALEAQNQRLEEVGSAVCSVSNRIEDLMQYVGR